MNKEELQTVVIAACTRHEQQNPHYDVFSTPVSIGDDYFVKYGPPRDLEPERATQEYIFTHAQQSNTPDAPRIARIIHHFVDKITMYIVMEHIKLQESPPDLATRIQKATKWLSEVPLPPNHTLGPVGGGCIRHKIFKDFEAPFEFPNLYMLDFYLKKAHSLLPPGARQRVPPVSVSGERLMFAQSDMDDSSFGVDEHGRTVLTDFAEVGVLPETFVAFTLFADHKPDAIAASLGLSGNSKLSSMSATLYILCIVANEGLGMAAGRNKKRRRA